MRDLSPADPDFETRVRRSFAQQQVMRTLGAALDLVEPGCVEISLPFHADWTQQHGFLHAGIVTAVVDSACGYAAMSLLPAEAEVLTVEYKVNFMAPAAGTRLLARGQVRKPGRTLTVCAGEAWMETDGGGDGSERSVATMLATIMQRATGRRSAKPT